MKKNFKYAFMSAIAFVGAVSFSACSSSDEIVDNPNYNPETNAVKTEFAININHPGSHTRMATANTQQDGSFLGMTDMYLFSTASSSAVSDATEFITTGKFALGSLAPTDITAEKSSKVYTMYVPVTTNNFLFYAKNNITGATAAQKGSLTYNVSTTATKPSDISFSLNPVVLSADEAEKVTDPETTLAGYMNTIENTTDWAGTVTTAATNLSYKGLSDHYQEFTKLSTRQGSSAAILRQVQDLYHVMYPIASYATADPDAIMTIARAVISNITGEGKGFSVASGSGENAVLAFTSTDAKVTNFPAEAGLPAGSAVLLYDKSSTATAGSKFSYASFRSNAIFGETPSTDMVNINTPAELVYYDNSPLRTSTQSLTESDFVSGTPANWEDDTKWTALGKGWTTGTDAVAVTSATRAVAMKYNIKYGVALLVAQVKLGEGLTSNKLTDNKAAIVNDGAATNQEDIDGTQLQLTGLIIGGQPASANWQFLPASTSFNQTIYDPITPVALSTTATAANYTLVLDNYNSEGAADVNIALEFLNNGKDFYGRDGLIATGQKFYLVGKLKGDATNATGTLTWPAGIPQSGNGRVFIQDFKTTAVFTIDNGSTEPARNPSLQNAYSVIPDLRSTQMVFGLSVNLEWTPGLTYNISL